MLSGSSFDIACNGRWQAARDCGGFRAAKKGPYLVPPGVDERVELTAVNSTRYAACTVVIAALDIRV